MRIRTLLHFITGTLLAGIIIFVGTALQAKGDLTLSAFLAAQKATPALWALDICAIGFIGIALGYSAMMNHFHNYIEEVRVQHQDQLDTMIERTVELEEANAEYADRIERLEAEMLRQSKDYHDQITTLEVAADARQALFVSENRRATEIAYRSFQGQLEANIRQLEAVNSSLHYQRSELRKLRHDVRDLQRVVGARYDLNSLSGSYEDPRPEGVFTEQEEVIDNGTMPNALDSEFAVIQAMTEQTDQSADWDGDEIQEESRRNSSWKTRVERLFNEGKVIENLAFEDIDSTPAIKMAEMPQHQLEDERLLNRKMPPAV